MCTYQMHLRRLGHKCTRCTKKDLNIQTSSVVFSLSLYSGVRLSPLGTEAKTDLLLSAPDDRWWWLWSNWWNEDWQRKPKYSQNTYPSATLSTTNPIWPDPGSNPGRRGGKLATNNLSYCADRFVVHSIPIPQWEIWYSIYGFWATTIVNSYPKL
jgi:hypothetical protein